MPGDRGQRLSVLGDYLETRRWRWLLATTVVTAAVVGGWGSLEAVSPAATDTGGVMVPYWRLLVIVSSSLPVLTLSGRLDAFEATGGSPYQRVRSLVLGASFVVSGACVLTATAVGVGPAVVPLVARALLAWFGLALLSGRVLGWIHAWVLPCVMMCAVVFWGHDRSGQGHRWWEFTAQPIGHLPSMILTVALLAAGVASYALSPWRIHRLTRAFRVRPGSAAGDESVAGGRRAQSAPR